MGEYINTMFEKQMVYVVYDNGLGNILGRDIICMIFGFNLAIILICIIELAKELEKSLIWKIKRWRKRREKEKTNESV